MKLSKTQQAILALIIANTIWGAGSPIFKWALHDIHPFTLALLRFYLPMLILLPFAFKHLHIDRKDIKNVFLIGFLGVGINISFFFLGLTKTNSINAPIIASAAPIFVIFISLFYMRVSVKAKTVIGALLGFCGVILIILEPLVETGLDASFYGNLLLILSMLGAVGNIIFGKEISKKYKTATLTFYSFAIGCLCFLPFAYFEIVKYGFFEQLTTPGLIGVLYGTFGSSLISYYCLYWGLSYISASEAGLFTYVDPITAIIIAMPLLGEKPTVPYLIGSVLVFIGIYIAESHIHYHPFHLLRNKSESTGAKPRRTVR